MSTDIRAALAADPVGEGPSDQEIADVFSQGCRDISRSHEPPFLGGARAILARWGRPAAPAAPAVPDTTEPIQEESCIPNSEQIRSSLGAPPAPEPPAEALAARPILEQVAAMADCIGANTVGTITAISSRAAAWLRDNPPGQPVAVEPRGCPTPGACSCVEPAAPQAPEPGEVGESVDRLGWIAAQLGDIGWSDDSASVARAATLLQQQAAPAPVPVAVAVAERLPGEGDCDAEGRCWWFSPPRLWASQNPPVLDPRLGSAGRGYPLAPCPRHPAAPGRGGVMISSFLWTASSNPSDFSGIACFKVGDESVTVAMDNYAQAAKLNQLIEKACGLTKRRLIDRATNGISDLLKGYHYD